MGSGWLLWKQKRKARHGGLDGKSIRHTIYAGSRLSVRQEAEEIVLWAGLHLHISDDFQSKAGKNALKQAMSYEEFLLTRSWPSPPVCNSAINWARNNLLHSNIIIRKKKKKPPAPRSIKRKNTAGKEGNLA